MTGIAGMTVMAEPIRSLSATLIPSYITKPVTSGFAFVGAYGERHGIHVYAVTGDHWSARQFIPCEAPVALALHPNGQWLYALNEVSEYQGLPWGTLEAFTFDAKTSQLTSLGRQALSLSAVLPRSVVVSPDREKLIVAVHGGGAYNLLPILRGGRPGRVSSVIKVTGSGPIPGHQDTAHPQYALFDSTGKRIIATDLGTDTITTFVAEDGLQAHSRYEMPAGSGPRHLALHPNGELLFVANVLDGSISGLRYDSGKGSISAPTAQIPGVFGQALAMHPSGRLLLTAGKDEVAAWEIHSSTGTLQRVRGGSMRLGGDGAEGAACASGTVHDISFHPNGRSFFVLADQGVTCGEIHSRSGRLSPTPRANSLQGIGAIRSVAFRA